MFGSKRREIADLKRALRVSNGQRDDAKADARAAQHTMRTAARLYAAENLAQRLDRALRACARYRQTETKLARRIAELQARHDHAVGLDSPALDAGALWQDRRHDKIKGFAS